MSKKVKLTYFVRTRFVGSDVKEEVELELPDNYNVEQDSDSIIAEDYECWLYDNIDSGWYETD